MKPDLATQPEDWVCPDCGHGYKAHWVGWARKWIRITECQHCAAIVTGREALAAQRERTFANYQLNEGVRAHMTLANYQPDPNFPSQARAKEAVLSLVEKWKAGDYTAGLMLASEQWGVGKTHLAIAAARMWAYLYEPPKYGEPLLSIWNMPNYIDSIKKSYGNGGSAAAVQESATQPGLLVMDDLGAEYFNKAASTDWYQTLILAICESRWSEQKATIVTTNLSQKALRERIGERAFSRLVAMVGRRVEIVGLDHRIKELGQ